MARPTVDKIKAANPGFFAAHNSLLFGDTSYTLKGFIFTIKGLRENSDRRLVQESHQYAVHPDSFKLNALARDRKTNQPYCFVDHDDQILTQWLNPDGSPDGPPSHHMPNQHEHTS